MRPAPYRVEQLTLNLRVAPPPTTPPPPPALRHATGGHSPEPDHGADVGTGAHGGHGGLPHEAPWVMALPLVVLAILSFVGGLLNLPWHPSWAPLRWLGPVFGARLYDAHQSGATQWVLGVVDAAVAVLGLAVAFPLWTRRPERPALEPAVLQRSWYLDDIYDALIGRPGQAMA